MERVIGVMFFIAGIIFLLGNALDWWPFIPYTGFITMAFGTFIKI